MSIVNARSFPTVRIKKLCGEGEKLTHVKSKSYARKSAKRLDRQKSADFKRHQQASTIADATVVQHAELSAVFKNSGGVTYIPIDAQHAQALTFVSLEENLSNQFREEMVSVG
jgi:phage pi2 protein 07